MKLQVTVDVPMTVEQLAGLFSELDDDAQARFFVEVARVMQSWSVLARYSQPFDIGRHLRDCTCSTEEARDLIRAIADGMQAKAGEAA